MADDENQKWSIAWTFCECGENGNRMEKIGEKAKFGLKIKELEEIYYFLKKNHSNVVPEMYYLSDDVAKKNKDFRFKDAAVLVIRNGVKLFLNDEEYENLIKKSLELKWDKKKYMYGRVCEAKMRYNICIADFSQKPDYENKKGRVVNFKNFKELKKIRDRIPKFFGEKSKVIKVCEGNYYYNSEDCAIRPHIDDERSFVYALRLGEPTMVTWQWYQKSKPISKPITVKVNSGDFYIMSHYATGHIWGKGQEPALRHSAGPKRFRIPK